MTVIVISPEGTVWEGKMANVPSAGDLIRINNKTKYGNYVVLNRRWAVDEKKVLLRVKEE
jgi:hypothetical protein